MPAGLALLCVSQREKGLGGKVNLEGRGLSREDQILARVVLDLGLADRSDVDGAVDLLAECNAKGEGKSLSEILQETGCLHPRFASAVDRAVKTRLAVDRSGSPEGRKSKAGAKPSVKSAARSLEQHQALPGLGVPKAGTAASASKERSDEDASASGAPAPALYARVPKGKGYGLRSKSEVASAWAAFKKGKPSAAPESKRGAASAPGPEAADEVSPGEEEPSAPALPEAPAAPPVTPERKLRKRVRRGRDLEEQQPAPTPKGYSPRRRRLAASGVTQEIDLDAIKEELGLDEKSKAAKEAEVEAEAVPKDEKQKEIALRAFVRRVLPSPLHHQLLDLTLRRRLTQVSPARLAREAGCRERDAKRVLEDWVSGGVTTRGKDEYDLLQYQFSPSKADLSLTREFMVLWADPDWHQRLLTWILED